MEISNKILKTFLFLLYIPIFRVITPFFIKITTSILGENLKEIFTLSFKMLKFMSKYIVPIMVIVMIFFIWF
jgi:hypothetical protein